MYDDSPRRMQRVTDAPFPGCAAPGRDARLLQCDKHTPSDAPSKKKPLQLVKMGAA
jgi:hypothetical protein